MRFKFYHEPGTTAECLEILSYYKNEAKILAGGTDLVLKLRSGTVHPVALVNVGNIPELQGVHFLPDGTLHIGAMTRMYEAERSDLFSGVFTIVREGARSVSSMQIRSMATIGGNSCNASPSADTVPALIAVGAVAVIRSDAGERSMPLDSFFKGPGKTVLAPDELLVGFDVRPLPGCSGGAYRKFAIRGTTDIAIVGVAVHVTIDAAGRFTRARIVLGAVGPTPIRAREAEEILIGHTSGDEVVEAAAEAAVVAAKTISDQRATAEYRRHVLHVTTRNALWAAGEAVRQSETFGR